jgi:hypothetical protein
MMLRNPFLEAYMGSILALGGPLGLLLPQRLFLAMLVPQTAPVRRNTPGRSNPDKINTLA